MCYNVQIIFMPNNSKTWREMIEIVIPTPKTVHTSSQTVQIHVATK